MKRIWFAGIFLALAVIMCAAEQVYIDNMYDTLQSKISLAQKAVENKDYEKYLAVSKEISNYWDEKNDILYSITEHAPLDNLALQIRTLPYDKEDAPRELKKLKAMLFAFYEDERISLANIS